jgi:hypothetical protein
MIPAMFLRSLKKTPIVLDHVLRHVNHETARTITDGPDGWNILIILCHLRDIEEVFYTRNYRMVHEDHPTLVVVDGEAWVTERAYANQGFRDALRGFSEWRRKHIELLESLSDEQWKRTGLHPERGVISVQEMAMYTTQHDIDHIEQIVHMLPPG